MPAAAQIVVTDNTPVANPGGQTVDVPATTTQTVDSGDNIELEDNTNDNTIINVAGTMINNDGDDEDVNIFVDNSEDDVVINIASTGVLQGVDGVIFYEGDGATIINEGLIEGTGNATEAVVYFDRDADGAVNFINNSGTITGVDGPTIGVDTLLGTDPSSGTVGDEEGIARFTLINSGTISNTGVDDGDSDAINFNGDPGTTGGEARGCLENDGAFLLCQVEVDITNSGTISAARDNGSNAAIRFESDVVVSGTVLNEMGGQITGARTGVYVNGAHADHSLAITNAGTITGTSGDGVLISGTGVTLTNQMGGMISGGDAGIAIQGTTIDIDIGPSNLEDVAVAANNINITNAGTISGGDAGVEIGSNATGAILNNSGTITGSNGITTASGGLINNSGTITGTGGQAIISSGDFATTVSLAAGSTVDGDIVLNGVLANNVNIEAGAVVTGIIEGGDGTGDSVDLAGMGDGGTLTARGMESLSQSSGDFTFSAATTGFTQGIEQTGGILTMNGDIAGGAEIGDGAAFGGTGSLAGAVEVANGGILQPGDDGVGTLTAGGLVLASESILNFDLGAPDTPGASDLLQINGDLTLDGTVNAADAGSFGVGVYRLIDYTGSLTDNILDVGTLPMGFTLEQAEVQTAVANQVNLIISEASDDIPDVQFWDGADIAADDTIDGGTGSWGLAATNWTNSTGDTNFAWNENFAAFSGEAGTVTVDGAINLTGLQFITDGYTIADGTGGLTITEAETSARVDVGVSATISSAIAGTGGLNKQDVGTLTLSGANTYTGNTAVSGGLLVLDGSVAGTASVADGATLAGSGAALGVVSVADGGTLAPGGDGSVGTLTTGGLVLSSASVLSYDLGAPDMIAASDRLQVNGDLTLDGTLNTNDIGGFGIGVYRLIDYTGGLTDNGLAIGTLPMDITLDQAEVQTSIDNQVNLVISAGVVIPDIQFWDGTDAAGDDVIDGGAGSWNLVDANWTDAAGEVNAPWNENFAVFQGPAGAVSVDGDIVFTGLQFVTSGYELTAGNGSLTTNTEVTNVRVDPGATATISTAIGGTGGLNKLDSGTLVLNGDHTYTGDTLVAGGLLLVNGSLASVASVDAGGMLGGSGSVGGLSVTGTVSPGNSIGTLNIAGDIAFAAGSQFDVEVLPDGSSDLIAASGEAMLSGGTVNVLAGGGLYNISTDYTILTADDGVTGTFDSVNSNLAFLTPTLSYGAETVMLNLTRNDVDFAAIGATPNQSATGAAIQSQGNSVLANQIVNLDAATARDGFDQLSGEIHPSVLTVMTENNRLVRNSVLDRLATGDSGAFWTRGWGHSGKSDGDSNAAGLSRDSWGVMLGVDEDLGETGTFGLAVSYSQTDIDLAERSGSAGLNLGMGELETVDALAYVGFDTGSFNARIGVGHGWTGVDTNRSVSFAGVSDNLIGNYSGTTLYGFAEVGYNMEMGEGFIEPFAGLAIIDAKTKAFTENGGRAALGAGAQSDSTTIGTAGLRAGTGEDGPFSLRGKAGWQHVFGDDAPTTTAMFGNGSPFVVAGAPQSGDAAFAQVEGRFKVSGSTTIGIAYDGLVGTDSDDHSIMGSIAVAF